MNEDYVAVGPDWALVLDGATAPTGIESGCIHNVPWLVGNLASCLASRLCTESSDLADILASAIEETTSRHADTCDTRNPASPSSTVAMARYDGSTIEYLTLADSPIVVGAHNGRAHAIVDDRTAHLPSYKPEDVRAARNSPGGFWVASTVPDAAYQAVVGTLRTADVSRLAILSDGSARYVDRFGLSDWSGLLNVMEMSGPGELIERVRAAEMLETEDDRRTRKLRGKVHDDATAVLLLPVAKGAGTAQRVHG
ncbi:protein phosphatase 2C domain-containing protein [Actinokineospora enzanensis]|uniref:protein phosphatase 2C domain-containing protein n=1 Tax=Actinokineospora enzanensis TaxID=155975 RepID=UPI001FDF82A1|nr:protein phosphatase 2C domain-containing protein [Actinokineospora enzanensis]